MNFRGLLKLHSRYGLQTRGPPKANLCPKAPTRPVTRPSRLVATMPTDNYYRNQTYFVAARREVNLWPVFDDSWRNYGIRLGVMQTDPRRTTEFALRSQDRKSV